MGLREVKTKLKTLKMDELIDLIGELYKKNKPVKEYLDYWLAPDEEELHREFVEKVVKALYPKQGCKVRLNYGKKAISNFKKFKPRPVYVADLMTVYVEVGTLYSAEIGDYDTNNLTSVHSMLYDVMVYLNQNNLVEVFRERFEDYVFVSERVGGYFHEITMQVLFDFIPDFLLEEEEDDEEPMLNENNRKAIILEFPKK